MNKSSMKEAENLILLVNGGIGKNIMATAVVRNLKREFPEKNIYVLAGFPDVFLKNPHLKRVLSLGQPSFIYEDYFKDKKSFLINVEPYQSYDYIHKRRHLTECWCDDIGISCDSVKPEIFFTENESKMSKFYLERFDKEMVLIQGEGGKAPKDCSEKEKIISNAGMYRRSLPTTVIQEITDGLIERNFMVGVVGTPNQFVPSSAERISFPVRAILALIPHVAGVIAIDSFLQHGTAVFNKKSVIVWGGTNPKALGYEQNVNLTRNACDTPMCHRPNSYLWDFEPTGFMWDCPFNDRCMNYSSEQILQEFDKIIGGRKGEHREPRYAEDRTNKDCHCNPDLGAIEGEALTDKGAEGNAPLEIPST